MGKFGMAKDEAESLSGVVDWWVELAALSKELRKVEVEKVWECGRPVITGTGVCGWAKSPTSPPNSPSSSKYSNTTIPEKVGLERCTVQEEGLAVLDHQIEYMDERLGTSNFANYSIVTVPQ
jgi:hypothetical protein